AFVRDKSSNISTSQVARMPLVEQSSNFKNQLLGYNFLFKLYLCEVCHTDSFKYECSDYIKNSNSILLKIYLRATRIGQWTEKKEDFEPYLQCFFEDNFYDIGIFYDKITNFLQEKCPKILVSENDFELINSKLLDWMKDPNVLKQMLIPITIENDGEEIL
ncbi:MAG: hypothetical protein IJ730_04900, partial [Alphaproteobacteria bacterium]|nr:hypothetical protein [Alphaproteobacteria bacterium]